ncbi:efflux RND transporter periplasmic adaptor subunit [Sinorhizobium terangae]|uniref:Efflux RND transporter periplasmic adaptor subunit n=1 Tax=Sinorhizobium terangae TaxID=110322 RepID=A0A6N7LID4_SINTE|nr:efflux RND transporter periplasmic adaptor subunit [Sinorhizobium terangae]MBB4185675.1 membrane fusion protein (multidrug efflux system) [Sinorhizobium terangae]MQX17542.1 efflux RND transporter periplasmic adaptor subunit [Sinorhizobium terangae]WFU46268.1 efflux RND transporter periplasmic adaptor subunit [Sinorhizobium terangae]
MRGSRILAAALSAGLLVAIPSQTAFAQQAQAPAPAVVVAPAAIMDLRESADFTGKVVAIQRVDIRARVSGFLEKVNFTEGDKVTAGTLLYEVEDGTYRAAVQEIQGSIEAAEAARDLAVLERDRAQRLISSNTVAQATVDTANAQVKKAEADIVRLTGSKQAAELNLSYTRIVAPFDGVLGLTSVDVGALVGPDSGALVTLTRLDPINVEFPVSTAIFLEYRQRALRGEVGRDANVELLLPDGTTYPKKGTINFVSSNVAAGTDTITVRAEFPNPDALLLDGTLVRVTLEATDKQEVLAVPQQAIQRDQQGAFVMVVGDDSKVELRRVDVQRTARGQAVIAKGLKEGERVITDGVGKVRPGIAVDAALATGG